MCGIAALFLKAPDKRHAAMCRSLDIVRHRGPDGRGIIWGRSGSEVLRGETSEEPFSWALGHVRLAILDPSDRGSQPMAYGGDRYWIVYNGEVYNYVELRADLENDGFEFHTRTDTEVILAAYQRWGERCVERFVGMFAFVLVDLVRCRVFTARDRFGVKPLHFWRGPFGTFVCSEPKQLAAFPEFSFRANGQQLIDFLSDDVLNHIPDESMFEGVTPLAPGHFLAWSLDEPAPAPGSAQPYWSLPDRVRSCGVEEAVELFREALIGSVRLRLRSDVPVGSCLSGGTDSSSLVGIVSRDFGVKLQTFSSCFDGFPIDEQVYIDAVNQHCGTTPRKVFPTSGDLIQEFDKIVYHQDEPFGGPGVYSQWCVMRAARQHGVPVLLDGQGGDEVLCGYKKYSYFYLKHLLHQFRYARTFMHATQTVLRGDPQMFQFAYGQRYLPRFFKKTSFDYQELLRPAYRALRRSVWRESSSQTWALKAFQRADLLRWSLPALLRFEDRSSMAFSVESRVPFLDHRIVELCMGLPEDLFFVGGRSKRLLTSAMGDRLPEEVHRRRTKFGFSTPCDEWMRGDLGLYLMSEVRDSPLLREVVDTHEAVACFTAYREGRKGLGSYKLFALGCLAIWMRLFHVDFGASGR